MPKVFLFSIFQLYLFLLISSSYGMVLPEQDAASDVVTKNDPFASKSGYNFRGTGVKCEVAGFSTTSCQWGIGYPHVKFNGLEVINSHVGDWADLKVLDNASGSYSTIPFYTLNQFGFNWYFNATFNRELLPYASDLYAGMIIEVLYHNATTSKEVYINYYIHQE